MEKNMLAVTIVVLFLGGLFGFAMGIASYFGGKSPAEYGLLGIGGGIYLFLSAAVTLIKSKLK